MNVNVNNVNVIVNNVNNVNNMNVNNVNVNNVNVHHSSKVIWTVNFYAWSLSSVIALEVGGNHSG
jgi:hypothetical protein